MRNKIIIFLRCPTRYNNRADDVRAAVGERVGLALRLLRGRRALHHVVRAVAAAGRLHAGDQSVDLRRGEEVHREQRAI